VLCGDKLRRIVVRRGVVHALAWHLRACRAISLVGLALAFRCLGNDFVQRVMRKCLSQETLIAKALLVFFRGQVRMVEIDSRESERGRDMMDGSGSITVLEYSKGSSHYLLIKDLT
jgi:hypothetical protein